MRHTTLKIASFVSFFMSFHAAALASDELEKEWKLVKSKNDIQVYMKHTDNSKLKTFKGVTEFKVDEPLKFATVVNDYDFLATLLHLVSSLEEMTRASDLDRDLRIETRLPWPVKNRDMAVKVTIAQEEPSHNLYIDVSDIKDKYPKNDGFIRMPYMDALLSVELLEEQTIRVTYRAILDPGGYVPAFMVNIMMKDAPYYTLKKVKRVLQSDAYAGGRESYIQYPENW